MSLFGKPADGSGQPAAGTTFGAIGGLNKSAGFSFGGGEAPKPGGFSFGATSPGSIAPPLFGATSPPAFGSPSTTQQTIFGSTPSTTAAQPSFAFGQQPASGFGGFGGAATQANTMAQPTSPLFGAKSTALPAFGSTQITSTVNFGQVAPSTTSAFSAPAPTSAFPAPAAVSAFTTPGGATGFAAPAGTPAFPTSAAAPSFSSPVASVAGSGLFGPKPTAAFPASTAPTFGSPVAASIGSNFNFGANLPKTVGQVTPTTAAPSYNFGANTGIVGSSATTAAPLPTFSAFNFSQSPGTTSAGIGFGTNTQKPALSFDTTGVSGASNTIATTAAVPNMTTAAPAFPTNFGSGTLGQAPVSQPASSVQPLWGAATAANPITATPTSVLNFGAPMTSIGGIGIAKPIAATTTSALPAFGLQPASTAQSGYSFQSTFPSTTAKTSSAALSSPSIVAALTGTPKTQNPSFVATEVKTTPTFSLGNTAIQTPPTATSLPAATSVSAFTALQMPQSQTFSLPGVTSLTEKTTTTNSGTLGGLLAQPAATTIPSITSSAITTPTAGFQLTMPASTTPATTASTQPLTTVTAPAQPVPATSINFGQLEDSINKWSLELEEQEKVFINQATQVNAWDKLLIANGEKIVTLNDALQNVRTEQQSLDHELDFVLGQQRELEELLVPLEKELGNVVISDPEREHTYRLADSIDTQLKQMSEDLKEIIEHLNESNRREDNNDPIVQIGRILNAHMSSLQWIDSSTASISNKLDTLSNMHNTLKRRNKMSFNLTYK